MEAAFDFDDGFAADFGDEDPELALDFDLSHYLGTDAGPQHGPQLPAVRLQQPAFAAPAGAPVLPSHAGPKAPAECPLSATSAIQLPPGATPCSLAKKAAEGRIEPEKPKECPLSKSSAIQFPAGGSPCSLARKASASAHGAHDQSPPVLAAGRGEAERERPILGAPHQL